MSMLHLMPKRPGPSWHCLSRSLLWKTIEQRFPIPHPHADLAPHMHNAHCHRARERRKAMEVIIGCVGKPSVGKSTFFNAVSGGQAKTGT